jgi:hypothetical protein
VVQEDDDPPGHGLAIRIVSSQVTRGAAAMNEIKNSENASSEQGAGRIPAAPPSSDSPNATRARAFMRSNLLYNHYLRALRVQSLCQPAGSP